MGAGAAAARRSVRARRDGADRAGEPGRVRPKLGPGSGPGLDPASSTAAATDVLAEAESLLREGRGRAEDALPVALRALRRAAGRDDAATTTLPALGLVAEIYLELGDATAAREYFLQAVSLDPEGRVPETLGGGAEKFLWLAQLSEEGGQDSVAWFERGAAVLRREIGALGEGEGEGGGRDAEEAGGGVVWDGGSVHDGSVLGALRGGEMREFDFGGAARGAALCGAVADAGFGTDIADADTGG
ncbi:hypothetical protein HO173_005164 [Letharia columbiana]|uniref:Tetratricopeptide repeat protein n=1 Tax=Letharia columbiana TaxID=112416 RepID=A0A8H6L5Y4_9LECA|nr:uncharacterized protein HO173_005164 [Letharia columbiana]KAF6236873.1 hypothetical protein HO173_005164 [Letharia columbiana]